jgi:acetyl-CoA carboxylase biotin carboxyl carrier protein
MRSSTPLVEASNAGAGVGASALLEIDKIRQLVDMMVANDLVEISLRDGDVEVSLRRPGVREGGPGPVLTTVSAVPNHGATPAGRAVTPGEAAPDEQGVELAEIKSPMVGTYYSAPDPDSPPFADVGTHVTPETVVCVVEAMKVFNEIKAEISGTIEKVLVKNEQPVEYGQPLFLARLD